MLPEKTISPENKLNCSYSDIKLLYDSLPPRVDCKIKDFEETDAEIFIYYKGLDDVEFEIIYEKETQNVYATPIETVKELISKLKEGQTLVYEKPEIQQLHDISSWVQEQIRLFHEENGHSPEFIEISFELDGNRSKIRAKTADILGNSDGFEDEEEDDTVYGFSGYTIDAALKLMVENSSTKAVAIATGLTPLTIKLHLTDRNRRMTYPTVCAIEKHVLHNLDQMLAQLRSGRCKTLDGVEKTMLREFLEENENHVVVQKTREVAKNEDVLERLKFDFSTEIGVAAIKLACHFDSKSQIAKEIGIPYHNIMRYTNQHVRRFQEETAEKIQTWLFRNMRRLFALLQSTRRTDKALSIAEQTVLDEFLFEHKDDFAPVNDETTEFNGDFNVDLLAQALRIAKKFKSDSKLTAEIGITRGTLGRYLYGLPVTTRKETQIKFQNWLFNFGHQIIEFIDLNKNPALYKFVTEHCQG